jgi:FSR family fosmidomycin resistance protein-like MFS transporter
MCIKIIAEEFLMKNNTYSYLTMFGHICTDINQGALPALLPFLVLNYGYSYAVAGSLVFAVNLVSAIIQPLFGYLGDRSSRPWLMSLGIFLAGGGLAIIGFFNDYHLIFMASIISGIGIALFHPEGGRIANLVAGDNKGTGMSIFAVGGSIGFAIGPIIVSTALATMGMKGTIVLLIPAIISAIFILTQNKKLKSFTQRKVEKNVSQPHCDRWAAFSLVIVLLSLRSIVYYALTSFIPLFCIVVLSQTEYFGSVMLVIFAVIGGIAILSGGRFADRFGFKRIILIALTILCPSVLIFSFSKHIILAAAIVPLLAIGINLGSSPLVALAQRFLPSRLGLASGMSYGVAICIGGIFAPGIGFIGDIYGFQPAMIVVAIVSLLLLLLTFALPGTGENIKSSTTLV